MSSPPALNPPGCNVSDDTQTIYRSSSQLTAIDELLLKIPIDLIIEIFWRLPLKSIARCRCVSKQWASLLRRPDFTELFLTKSLARPRPLFARQEYSEVIFFSSPPQPLNPDENLSLIATVDHHMSVPFESVQEVSCCVNEYVCISDYRMSEGRDTKEVVYVICNPSTGQCLTLPKMNTTRRNVTVMRCFLGYDPIEKQHKVLGMIKQEDGAVVHQVLTLRGNGNVTWRRVECGGIHHYFPARNNICISGVLYYIAKASIYESVIVCFDVRSEKYSSVKAMERDIHFATLINFQDKLASLTAQPDPFYLSETSTSLEMRILEDPEKHEWSKRIFKLPPMWKDVVEEGEKLYVVGATDTNEFVISPLFPFNSFHVYYYNFVKESITRVEIQGIGTIRRVELQGMGMGVFDTEAIVHTFLNHVEDVKLL